MGADVGAGWELAARDGVTPGRGLGAGLVVLVVPTGGEAFPVVTCTDGVLLDPPVLGSGDGDPLDVP